ncbi:enoyl-CoA hydratase/isomerase family protein [Nocardia carnea]|uniref:enoyl-CoA hydratase/isomerase family protein n=1 Tax=Nocardia carnea TaxID=37328 RepID=UPI0024569F13|nr:enoyl-CoA hydratase/isomerase family protein [Nocardia carnea]
MTVTMSENVGFEVSDGIAVLELRRPEKRNAVSREMWQAMLSHLELAAGRADVRVLVVQGSGGVFCAGADLTEVKGTDNAPAEYFRELVVRTLSAVAAFPAPSIARIEGPCIGGGCSLALACDFRFAHPGAVFAIPAVRHGIVYDEHSVARLVELMGPSRAARMLYTAERLDASEAARAGLVDECGADLDVLIAGFSEAVTPGDRDTIAAIHSLLRATAHPTATLRV